MILDMVTGWQCGSLYIFPVALRYMWTFSHSTVTTGKTALAFDILLLGIRGDCTSLIINCGGCTLRFVSILCVFSYAESCQQNSRADNVWHLLRDFHWLDPAHQIVIGVRHSAISQEYDL